MQIVTNPGSNLSGAVVRHYGIHLTPQKIVVDGTAHETNDTTPLSQIDTWVRTAKTHPHNVGTTAQEFVAFLSPLLKTDPEVIAVMTSRKAVQSHLACVSAVRTLTAHPAFREAKMAVIDSKMTDVGPGLISIAAGEAVRARLPFERTVALLEALSERGYFAFTIDSLDYLVKGGRASWLKAQLASFLNVRPLAAFVDGEIRSVDRISSKVDPVKPLVDHFVARFGQGRRVWVGVTYGTIPQKAAALLEELRRRFDVQYAYVHPMAMTTYLNAGEGAIGACILPMDDLPWAPPTPPDFSYT